jgi:hypothetical protein
MLEVLFLMFMGIPILGSKYYFYFAYVLREISRALRDKSVHIPKDIVVAILALIIVGFMRQKSLNFVAIIISMILGYNLARRIKLTSLDINRIFYFLVCFHVLSLVSLEVLEYDYFPSLMYGESRHQVPASSAFPYRPSGLFQEPSSFCVVYFALLAVCRSSGYDKITPFIVLAGLLTFSGISLLGLLMINWRVLLAKSKLFVLILVPFMYFVVSNYLIPFVQAKVTSYSSDLESYSRVADILNLSQSDVLFGKADVVGVILDNGALAFLFLSYGIFSFPLILSLVLRSRRNIAVFFLLFVKLPLTLPLLWFVIFYENFSIRRA